ncbi:MAG: metallophosphoesterase [Proteobacteria bacterium]|nr:metallophosphoesterase [Pseudomonadota bacterium]
MSGCWVSGADERFLRGEEARRLVRGNYEAWISSGSVREENGALVFWASEPEPVIQVLARDNSFSSYTGRIGNLIPGTQLIYPDGSTTTAGIDRQANIYLPSGGGIINTRIPGGENGWKFAVISDIHNNQKVFEKFAEDVNGREISFVISLGDFTVFDGSPEIANVIQWSSELRAPFYTTIGNHESYGRNWEMVIDHFGASSYSFSLAGNRFIILDSANYGLGRETRDWLLDLLGAVTEKNIMVFTHVSPVEDIDNRALAFKDQKEGQELISLMTQAGVDYLFAGHAHSYRHFKFGGVEIYVSGGGGGTTEKINGAGYHYLLVDLGECVTVRKISLE